jgi:hypothetical protein
MWEWVSQSGAVAMFLGIGAIGFLFLLASFVFGEFLHGFDLGGDSDHDIGHDGPGIFSTRVLSVFLTTFGGVGAISVAQGYGVFVSALFGLGGGVALGYAVYQFARFLYAQQASSMVSSTDLVGQTAQVIVSIPKDGVGQVRCVIGESMVEKVARSKDGSPIPLNSTVLIEEAVGESVIVSPWAAYGEGRGLFSFSAPASEENQGR